MMSDAEVAVLSPASTDNMPTEIAATNTIEAEAAVVDLALSQAAATITAQVMEARDNGAVGVRGAQSTEVILEVIEDEDDFDDDSVDDDDFVPKGPQSPAEASLDKKVSIIVKKEPSNASNTSKTQSDQDTDAKKKDDGKKDAKGH